jgi:hypothetical protein
MQARRRPSPTLPQFTGDTPPRVLGGGFGGQIGDRCGVRRLRLVRSLHALSRRHFGG